MRVFIDRIHRKPRIWSNRELEKFAHLFHGDVANVSGWRDIDKEGRRYREYFRGASSYTITNYRSEDRGFQGFDNEIFLNLEKNLPRNLLQRFDVVFNHTTLEHIYAVQKAFGNLCAMSRDVVILVLPFLQQYHSNYGDYWRFSPLAIKRMFEDNHFTLLYQSFNSHARSSVYIFTIASRKPEKWVGNFHWSFTCEDSQPVGSEPYIGCHAIPNSGHRLSRSIGSLLRWPNRAFKRMAERYTTKIS